MKLFKISLTLLLIPALLAFFISCSEDNGNGNGADGNRPPVINSLSANPDSVSVDLDSSSTLTVTASDPEGDLVSFYWTASAGSFDVDTGATVTWTAPDEAMQSFVSVQASDGGKASAAAYQFKYDAFIAVADTPQIVSVFVTVGQVENTDESREMHLSLFAKLNPSDGIIRVTAEPALLTVYNLRDDGQDADPVAGDYEYNKSFGRSNLPVNEGPVLFTAINKYYLTDIDTFEIVTLPDSLPVVVNALDSAVSVIPYTTPTPTFYWRTYPFSVNRYEVVVRDTAGNQLWPENAGESVIVFPPDTTVVYSSTSPLYLDNDYIVSVTARMDSIWARKNQAFTVD